MLRQAMLGFGSIALTDLLARQAAGGALSGGSNLSLREYAPLPATGEASHLHFP